VKVNVCKEKEEEEQSIQESAAHQFLIPASHRIKNSKGALKSIRVLQWIAWSLSCRVTLDKYSKEA
jgi:hypothetical protein